MTKILNFSNHFFGWITANHAKFAQFTHKFQQITQNLLTFIHIHSLLSDFWPSAENSRKLEQITQISGISPTVTANYAKFAHMASNLEVNPVNSRKIQQITQILHHSHTTAGKLHEIHDICAQTGKLRTNFTHIYAHCYNTYVTCMHMYFAPS